MPAARLALYQKGIEYAFILRYPPPDCPPLKLSRIYIAPNADDLPSWIATMQHIAKEGRCFVINSNQFCKVSFLPLYLTPTPLAPTHSQQPPGLRLPPRLPPLRRPESQRLQTRRHGLDRRRRAKPRRFLRRRTAGDVSRRADVGRGRNRVCGVADGRADGGEDGFRSRGELFQTGCFVSFRSCLLRDSMMMEGGSG